MFSSACADSSIARSFQKTSNSTCFGELNSSNNRRLTFVCLSNRQSKGAKREFIVWGVNRLKRIGFLNLGGSIWFLFLRYQSIKVPGVILIKHKLKLDFRWLNHMTMGLKSTDWRISLLGRPLLKVLSPGNCLVIVLINEILQQERKQSWGC